MDDIAKFIRSIADFPRQGIIFRDITPLLKNPRAYKQIINYFCEQFKNQHFDYVAAIESRGYLLGAPLALELGAGLVIIRKPGKLPAATIREEYKLEYGTDALEIHTDAIEPGKKVLLVDDLLASGGTTAAGIRLISRLGGKTEAAAFLIELQKLNGRQNLPQNIEITSLLHY